MFSQTFDNHDLVVLGVLVILEGILSIDNALVLGLLARRLPHHLQARALTYGLVGAFVFRVLAIATASFLLEWRIAKLLGGGYLVFVAIKHFLSKDPSAERKMVVGEDGQPTLADPATGKPLTDQQLADTQGSKGAVGAGLDYAHARSTHSKAFWMTVITIEITDIAFAVDSILAAIALVGGTPAGHPEEAAHPKMWVVITGGMLGVILMRFAAVMFIKLLEKFPRFETAAYLLVTVIGGKLVIDWALNSAADPEHVNFHSPGTMAFWIFWVAMAVCFSVGFFPPRKTFKPA